MLFEKVKFEQLGGFDTLFYPAYEEDRDLSYRALKRGWDLIFDFQTKVWHQHETTNQSIFGQKEMEINSWKNQFILVWKNADILHLWQHLAWLPFHLLVTNAKRKGTLGRGFWRALLLLPSIVAKRHREQRHWQLSDREILTKAQTFAPQLDQ
jgi:GT2 family glycosyltransferase